MASQVLTGIKRFILWDYPRASWQYDVMVGLILAFLFLTPRAWFRDQPRAPSASHVAMLNAAHGTNVYWIEAELLAGVADADRPAKASQLLRRYAGSKQQVVGVEPVLDSESDLKGYIAFTRP
jgi:hypothetical protein